MNRSIDFVYFDLGNILVAFDPKVAIANFVERFGIDGAHAKACLYESGFQEEYEKGRLTCDQFAEAVRGQIGMSPAKMSNRDLLEASSDMFTPIESMAETVAKVARRGTHYGLLSNTCVSHWEWIANQTWEISQMVWTHRIVSYEVGAMKPDPRIYAAAEGLAGVDPKRILFLDDKQENIDAAVQRGWNAVQCFGGESAERVLKDFDVID
ncbi:Alpha-D-glucose-1-phosphate phosphatase YihX [Novipirellula aureliae]|uniref:Alpha-D-glucose-1-phosphate phosphatase YihX n=1 Tax=Novipirellula aureliae TaxID=2527966 RepID=A0A5C6DG52_9BACT|nr:HAD family phosphatase [Novipirellula aureliae]TWU35770.1 Alpha-D-glucose-1-phosphate phosphatase YihX [Novipirellula aureliae]